ncbi:type II secretion system protein [Chitinimonas lacunae]|uniref:Type II secretion system protein n=1 Tax=Chitinimonas lacunae TaxID=1963018 RepID=A0ABV8MS96_9NEIS
MRQSTQRGFTLIELAMVLVIIGLLVGGVLKGRELIDSARLRNIIGDFDGIAAAVQVYRERYRALPGDDPGATESRGWAALACNGSGCDGLIGSAGQTPFGAEGETLNAWRGLRYAQLLTGDPAATGATALPEHAGGGRIGIGRGLFGWGSAQHSVCLDNLPGKLAAALDLQLDDGRNHSGSVRAAGTTAAIQPDSQPYSENGTAYVLCRLL